MKYHAPFLIPGSGKFRFLGRHGAITKRRWVYPLQMCRWLVEDMAWRINESQKIFPWKFYRGDCHSHTQHSDGAGTVAETAEMAQAAGLDFQFVTDHWGISQAPECRKHGLWVGQEPVSQHHHLGILGLNHAFVPKNDFLSDFAEAKRLGATVFLPHPTGWWPSIRYDAKKKQIVEKLPSPFLMEICNGANNIVSAFDVIDDSAVQLWDHLLRLGRVVHAMGNTDAHAPHAIGMVWNSVFASRCTRQAILDALSCGRSFVSDGPLVYVSLGRAVMGSLVNFKDRKSSLKITAVDSRGLASLRVVADGHEVFFWLLKGVVKVMKSLALPGSVRKYVRVEARSCDGRRVYSNPIYLS